MWKKKILTFLTVITILCLTSCNLLNNEQTHDENYEKCKELIDSLEKYNKTFDMNVSNIGYDEYFGDLFVLKANIKNADCFTKDNIEQCNNLKNDIEKFLYDNPDYFLVTEKYKIQIIFNYFESSIAKGTFGDKDFLGIYVSNFHYDDLFLHNQLGIIESVAGGECKWYKYFGNIKVVISDSPIEDLKEMPELEKIFLGKITSDTLAIYRKELPDIELIYTLKE